MSDRIGNYTGTCPFLDAVPVEIRIHIFQYILFEDGNFFSLDDEEGKSVPTLFPKLRAPPKCRGQRRESRESQAGDDKHNGCGNIMSLLLTSHKIYNEAASLLYSSAFFRLRGIQSTIKFINTVSPAHLALVRSLKLVWDDQGWLLSPEFDTPTLRSAWPSMCDALATSFPGLRNLYVALSMPSNEAHVEELYLGALRGVRHVGNFKVCIPVGVLERFEGLDGRLVGRGGGYEDAPFTLCRHTAGEVCPSRREVVTAEWMGASRPSTPCLTVQHPNVPRLEPWAGREWESGKDGREGGEDLGYDAPTGAL
ncbi:hypothetical protein VP1G_00570 [Cytospora mali]|uniref:DUF7730 domain-containing protein n=1 Tax=Cytospora mali TaxID=578113 RepID=A0A194UNU2_CYTMA|nr:hypothetical protein VP1G_00570 [Valsa mali var. pyri (nom. inval.)]